MEQSNTSQEVNLDETPNPLTKGDVTPPTQPTTIEPTTEPTVEPALEPTIELKGEMDATTRRKSRPSSHQRTLSEKYKHLAATEPLVKRNSKRFSLNSLPSPPGSPEDVVPIKKNSSTPSSPSPNRRGTPRAKVPELRRGDSKIPALQEEVMNYIQGTDLEALFGTKKPFVSSGDSGYLVHDALKNIAPPALPARKSPRERRFGQISISPTRESMSLASEFTDPSSSDYKSPSTKLIVQKIVNDFSQLEAGCEPVWERCDQSSNTSKVLTRFLRRRAALEEDYGKNMLKLLQMTSKEVEKEAMKDGTFGSSFKAILASHEDVGKNHVKLAQHVFTLADELTQVTKEKEALRKVQKETGARLKKNITESEAALEKTKTRYIQASEIWDKAIVNKLEQSLYDTEQAVSSQPIVIGSGRTQNAIVDAFNNIFSHSKTGDTLRKHEEDCKSKVTAAKRLYHQNHNVVNHMRHEYYTKQLPDLISETLSVLEETDQANKSFVDLYTSRYLASNQENIDIVSSNDPEKGLRSLVEKIDLHTDNLNFFTSQLGATRPINRHPNSLAEYSMSKIAQSVLNPKTVYGMSLEEQLSRDGTDVPIIVKKCVEFIEVHGLVQEGIYRRSGSSVKVNKIRDLFNLDASNVDLDNMEVAGDVDNVAGALKLYLRELPDSAVPPSYWPGFLAAHRTDSGEANQLEALRSALEKLPEINYNLLKYMILHLAKISSHEDENKMPISNISIVFGPTLFPPARSSNAVELMGQQCGVTMLLLSFAATLFSNPPPST